MRTQLYTISIMVALALLTSNILINYADAELIDGAASCNNPPSPPSTPADAPDEITWGIKSGDYITWGFEPPSKSVDGESKGNEKYSNYITWEILDIKHDSFAVLIKQTITLTNNDSRTESKIKEDLGGVMYFCEWKTYPILDVQYFVTPQLPPLYPAIFAIDSSEKSYNVSNKVYDIIKTADYPFVLNIDYSRGDKFLETWKGETFKSERHWSDYGSSGFHGTYSDLDGNFVRGYNYDYYDSNVFSTVNSASISMIKENGVLNHKFQSSYLPDGFGQTWWVTETNMPSGDQYTPPLVTDELASKVRPSFATTPQESLDKVAIAYNAKDWVSAWIYIDPYYNEIRSDVLNNKFSEQERAAGYMNRGIILLNLGDFEEARKMGDRLVKQFDIAKVQGYYLMARAQHYSGNFDDAIEYYDKVIALDSNYSNVVQKKNLAIDGVQPQLGSISSVGTSQKSLAQDPSKNQSEMTHEKEKSSEMKLSWNELVDKYNDARDRDNPDDKLKYLNAMYEIDKSNPKILQGLAAIESNDFSNYEKALKYADEWYRLDPTNLAAVTSKAVNNLLAGNYKEAVKYYDEYFAVATPDDAKYEDHKYNKDIAIERLGATKQIPDWIKNNVQWWADGQIDDTAFKQGVSFLIKEDIISIRDIPKSSGDSEENIPDWIKNNAKWWADGLIDEADFVNGIKYMVEKRIITVN